MACGPCRLQGRLIACDSSPVDRAREHCSSGDALPQNGLTPSGVRRLGFLGCRSPVRNASTGLQRESVNFQGSCVGQDEPSSPGGISDVWSRAKNVDMVGFGKKEGRKGERGKKLVVGFALRPSQARNSVTPGQSAALPALTARCIRTLHAKACCCLVIGNVLVLVLNEMAPWLVGSLTKAWERGQLLLRSACSATF